jgi:glycerol-3-phosphate dehydrogenase (NAD(P)+)
MAKISVIGSGSWGTALAWLLCNNGHQVTLWSFLPEETEMYRKYHQNTDKLPGVILPDSTVYTGDLAEACKEKDMLVLAVPSPAVRSTAAKMKELVPEGQLIVSVAKGIEENTLFTMSDIVEQEIPQANVAVLSGPSHAEEVGRGLPTAIVAGAHDKKTAEEVRGYFMSPVFRVYTSPDMKGIQMGAALKNVMALAAGIADGLGYGDNTKAALITRGSAELSRLGEAMGIHQRTIFGLSGIGDLIVTCASVHSRNRKAGFLMGQGKTMDEAMTAVHQVVEGVFSAKAGKELADKYQVEMPIVDEINKVLFEKKPAREAVIDLMKRTGKDEINEWD